jgi:hypothetical protein
MLGVVSLIGNYFLLQFRDLRSGVIKTLFQIKPPQLVTMIDKVLKKEFGVSIAFPKFEPKDKRVAV